VADLVPGLVVYGVLMSPPNLPVSNAQNIIFGTGFGVITDIKTGPDGNLYVLGYAGTIYKIS
jgi:hypothetical protein